MREFDYNPTKRMTCEEAVSAPQPVCVLTDADGEPQGVLVQAFGERFVIDPKAFNDGEEMKWDDAMTALKRAGKTTFNKDQAYVTLFLLTFINDTLLSIDGDVLASGYWTATEYDLRFALYVNFGSYDFGYAYKSSIGVVRTIRQFS